MAKEDHPINNIQWVPIEKVEANDYANESALAYRMGKLHGMKFSVRKVEGGVRVWRTA